MNHQFLTLRPPEEWVANWRKMVVRLAELEAAQSAAIHAGRADAAITYAGEVERQRFAMTDAAADLAGGAYATVCLDNPLAQPTPDQVDVQERGRRVLVVYTVREPHE